MTYFTFTAIRGRKIATAILDDGEFVITLSDRSTDEEARPYARRAGASDAFVFY
jgi:hypothetical protein